MVQNLHYKVTLDLKLKSNYESNTETGVYFGVTRFV